MEQEGQGLKGLGSELVAQFAPWRELARERKAVNP